MNHDEMIEVIQAHRDGAIIEYKSKPIHDWQPCPYPVWDFSRGARYRVAPKPRYVWVSRYANISMFIEPRDTTNWIKIKVPEHE